MIDKKWYLESQLHPVVSRMCAVIQGDALASSFRMCHSCYGEAAVSEVAEMDSDGLQARTRGSLPSAWGSRRPSSTGKMPPTGPTTRAPLRTRRRRSACPPCTGERGGSRTGDHVARVGLASFIRTRDAKHMALHTRLSARCFVR